MSQKIRRQAQDLTVTLYTDSWPRNVVIENERLRLPATQISLFGSDQLRALHWALGEIIAADPQPDKN
jgi:hypothetical protein